MRTPSLNAAAVRVRPVPAPVTLPDEVEVLVSGGGPVGSALAIELSRRGVRPLVLERRAEVQTANVRARNISVRTMELCRRWGVAGTFRSARTLPGDWHRGMIVSTRVAGYELCPPVYGDRPIWTPHAPWHEIAAEPPLDLPQYHVNRILRDRGLALGARLALGWEVESVEQDTSGVTVGVRHLADGRLQYVRAGYVVGCDGARSAVRRSAGIAQHETEPQGRMLNVTFRFPDGFTALGVRPGVLFNVFNGDVSGLISPYEKEWWRVGIGPIPLDTDVTGLDLRDQIRRYLGFDADIDSISYTSHVVQKRLVSTYRLGRVLVAGDAAVAFPPHLGQNLNTGVADAATLGWILAAVVQGWGGDGLLDGYAAERRTTSERLADATLAASTGWKAIGERLRAEPALEDDTPEGAQIRAAVGREIAALLGSGADGLLFDHRHATSPIVVPDGTAPPPFDPARYRPAALAGHHAPLVWLGEDDPLSDHFGTWFTLLDFGARDRDVEAIAQAAFRAGLPLTVLEVTDPEARARYDTQLVLVRPDHLIAWRGNTAPSDPRALMDTVRGAAADRSPTPFSDVMPIGAAS
jgi:2-polyprenyl-6-methoxyphenol hydroxylase-like FAD-dependent oxidoreductase